MVGIPSLLFPYYTKDISYIKPRISGIYPPPRTAGQANPVSKGQTAGQANPAILKVC